MDVLNRLRDVDPSAGEPPVDTTHARNELHRAIARAERGERHGVLGWVFGGALGVAAAATAVVVAVSMSNPTPVSPEAGPTRTVTTTPTEAAVAADVLLRAAIQVEAEDLVPAAGQYLRTDVVLDQVFAVTPAGSEEQVSYVREGATAGLQVRWTVSYYTTADPADGRIVSQADLAGTATYGDEAEAQALWDARYLAPYGPYGGTPDVYVFHQSEDQVPQDIIGTAPGPGSFDPDPQGFLDQWDASGRSFYPFASERSAAADMMTVLARGEGFYTAPAAYRATFLRALALAPDVEILSTDGTQATLGVTDDFGSLRLTIDTESGQMVRAEELPNVVPGGGDDVVLAVGTSPIFPENTPTYAVEVHQSIVDEAPAITSEG